MATKHKTTWVFKFISKSEIDRFCDDFEKELQAITSSAFQFQIELSHHDLVESLWQSTHVGLLKQGVELAGFCLVNIHDGRPLHGKTVVWINKIAIHQRFQHQGLGLSRVVNDLIVIAGPSLGFVGCCTQNTGLINSMVKVGTRTFPISCAYGTPEGVAAWTYINLQVVQVQNKLHTKGSKLDTLLDSNYGIIKQGYPKKINVSQVPLHPDIAEALNKRNFRQEEGDLLVLFTQLN